MSQDNHHIEETIKISEKLVEQLERHRDQGQAFGEAADRLRELGQRLQALEAEFSKLTPETLDNRLGVLEKAVGTVEEQSTQCTQALEAGLRKLNDSIREKADGLEEKLAGYKEHFNKRLLTLTYGVGLIGIIVVVQLVLNFLG